MNPLWPKVEGCESCQTLGHCCSMAHYRTTVRVDGLPKMANGGHESWMAASRRKKLWKQKMAKALIGLQPSKPWQRIRVRFIRCSTTEPDYDGLVHGFKAVRDALVLFGFVVDDGPRHMEGVYLWEKAPRGKGHIRVEFEEAR